eukprot:10203499-Ditylum_brightwellii.AAC.1
MVVVALHKNQSALSSYLTFSSKPIVELNFSCVLPARQMMGHSLLKHLLRMHFISSSVGMVPL